MFRAVASTDRSGQKAEATFVVVTRPAPTDQGVVTVSLNFIQALKYLCRQPSKHDCKQEDSFEEKFF